MYLISFTSTTTTNHLRVLEYTIFISTFECNWIDGISMNDFHPNDPTIIFHEAPGVSTFTSTLPNRQELHVAMRWWSLRENWSGLYFFFFFWLPYNERRMPSPFITEERCNRTRLHLITNFYLVDNTCRFHTFWFFSFLFLIFFLAYVFAYSLHFGLPKKFIWYLISLHLFFCASLYV